jgi:hypothetical protein
MHHAGQQSRQIGALDHRLREVGFSSSSALLSGELSLLLATRHG